MKNFSSAMVLFEGSYNLNPTLIFATPSAWYSFVLISCPFLSAFFTSFVVFVTIKSESNISIANTASELLFLDILATSPQANVGGNVAPVTVLLSFIVVLLTSKRGEFLRVFTRPSKAFCTASVSSPMPSPVIAPSIIFAILLSGKVRSITAIVLIC